MAGTWSIGVLGVSAFLLAAGSAFLSGRPVVEASPPSCLVVLLLTWRSLEIQKLGNCVAMTAIRIVGDAQPASKQQKFAAAGASKPAAQQSMVLERVPMDADAEKMLADKLPDSRSTGQGGAPDAPPPSFLAAEGASPSRYSPDSFDSEVEDEARGSACEARDSIATFASFLEL